MRFKGVIIICLLICLFSIAGASASDVNDTIVASDEQSDLMQIKNQDDVGVIEEDTLSASTGTFSDLEDEISNANGELNLTRNYCYDEDIDYEDGISINKKITINGNGFTIDGKNQARAIQVYYDDVVLSNIKFVNCFSNSCGGAVYIYESNARLEDCKFTNCYVMSYSDQYLSSDSFIEASSYGGAVYLYESNANLKNCEFTNCSTFSYTVSDSDSSTNSQSSGGAVYIYGSNARLEYCKFTNCSATSYSDSSSESSAHSYSYGGAVYLYESNGNLKDCNFMNCSASSHLESYFTSDSFLFSSSYGGAIYLSCFEGSLRDCNFMNCSASSYLESYSTSYSYLYSHSYGGAIVWADSVDILSGCSFVDCSAVSYLDSNRDSYSDFDSYSHGGAVYWISHSGTLSYCSFLNCFDEDNDAIKGIDAINCTFLKPAPFVSVSPVTVKYGQNATFTVNLAKDVPGNVKYNVNGINGKAPIKKGVATFTISGLNYGLYNVDISYGGNYKYAADTISTTLKVNKNSPIVSVIDNKNATITVNLASNVLGNVKITVNNITQKVEIIDNVASVTFAGLKRGTYDVDVSYAGNMNYVAQTKSTTMTITKGIPIISVDAPDVSYGENAVITVNLGTDVPGNAHITINGKTEKAKITNGKATYTVPALKAGSYEVTVTYAGNINYNQQTFKTTLTVVKIDPITSVSVKNIKVGNDAVVNVKLANNVNGFVKIILNGVTQRVQIVNGQASATFSGLKAGTYEVSAVYAGTAKFNAQTKTTSLSVTKNAAALRGYKSIVDGKVVIKATIASDAPGNVRLTVGDITYVAKITNGVATFNPLDIPSGTVVTLTYGGNYKYTAQTKTLTI